VRVNVPVLLFTIVVCGIAGILSGSAPAWRAARADLNESLKDAGRASISGRHGLRRALVVVEFALALTLLTGGGLMLQSFFTLTNRDLGISSDHVLTFSLPVTREKLGDAERIVTFYERVIDRLRAIPGAVSVSISTGLPVADGGGNLQFSIAGQPATDPTARPLTRARIVSPEYFTTFGIGIVRGRTFVDQDRAGAQQVAIVNETFVKRFLQGVDPLTQRIVLEQIVPFSPPRGPVSEWQIIGIARDVSNGGLRDPQEPEIELPFGQSPLPYVDFAVRTMGDPANARQNAAVAVQSIDPDLAVANVKPMSERVSELTAGDRFNSVLFGTFAAVALLLAVVGIYGVMSFVVAQRTHEIGLRVALGAERRRVLAQVLRDGMTPALLGTALGSVGAYFVARSMRGLLYGVNTTSPTTFIVIALILLAAAALACLLPARRAASLDPMAALRSG
jgi:putative ABC transport system permease protein